MDNKTEKIKEVLEKYAENVSVNQWIRAIHEDKLKKLSEELASLPLPDTNLEEIISVLNDCFLPHNIECDGPSCQGCWKDKVNQAIRMLKEGKYNNREDTAINIAEKLGWLIDELKQFKSGCAKTVDERRLNSAIRALAEYNKTTEQV